MIDFEKLKTSDSNNETDESEMNFDVLYNKYEDRNFPEKIHQIAHIEIRGTEGEINHQIDILNENPEVNLEDYAESIEKVLSRACEIHPQIIKEIKLIALSDYGKEKYDENNSEYDNEFEIKVQEGLVNAANAMRINNGFKVGYRGFKDIDPRYQNDNPDIETKSNISHFEMILGHELFHYLHILSQYENDTKRKSEIDESKKFEWMNSSSVNQHINSLEFSGLLSKSRYINFINKDGKIKDKWKDVIEFTHIKNKEGKDVKCQTNNSGLLRPEEDIVYPERFISNYAKISRGEEDFCDSMVAYAFDPKFLKEFDEKRGTKKFEWLEKRWGLYSKEKLDNPEIKMDIYKKDSVRQLADQNDRKFN